MSILDTAWRFLTYQPPPPPPVEVREAFGVRPISHTLNRPVWPKRSAQTFTDEGYAKLALVFRCIGVLAQSVAAAPLAVYQTTAQGEDRADNHPLRQLLTAPNRESNEARLFGQIVTSMATAGFVVIEKERAGAGRPVGLWPLNPAYCRPIQRSDALPDWEVKVPGYEPVILNSTDVIAITYADRPDREPTGIGPLEVILREVALLNIKNDFLKSFFDSGAMPVYGLVPHPDAGEISQAQADVIREGWRQRYGGMRGSVEPAILAGITDVKRLSFDFDELAWQDLRDIDELAICTAFGIPPILVGTRYGLERSTFANYQEARRSFYEDTVAPLMNRIEDAFSRSLMPEFERRPGYALHFDTSDVPAMREDIMPRRQWAVTALQAGGITTHQFARECGLEPVGADVFLRSMVTVEIPANGARPVPPATITAADEDSRTRALPSRAAMHSMEYRASIAESGRTAYVRVAERFEPEVARYLDEQAKRVVDAATRSGEAIRETRDVSAIDWADEERLLAELLERLHMASGEVAFQIAATAFGPDSPVWTVTNPRIMDLLTELARRVTMITETTRLDISRVVTEALTEGVSMDQLADRLRNLFDQTYANRAMVVARTESQIAYNRASLLSYGDMGIQQVQMYDNSEHTERYDPNCSTCAERDGLVVPIHEAAWHINCEHPNGILAVAAYVDPTAP